MSHRRGSPRCYIIGEKRPFQILWMEGNLSRIHSWKVERREECGSAIIKPGYVLCTLSRGEEGWKYHAKCVCTDPYNRYCQAERHFIYGELKSRFTGGGIEQWFDREAAQCNWLLPSSHLGFVRTLFEIPAFRISFSTMLNTLVSHFSMNIILYNVG